MPRVDKEAGREYQKRYDAERHRLHVLKCHAYLGGHCVDCGATENLEISHNDIKLFDPLVRQYIPERHWDPSFPLRGV